MFFFIDWKLPPPACPGTTGISFRCRLLEGFSCGLVFCLSFSCRLLEGSGCGDKVKKLKTPHAFHVFFQFGFLEVRVLEHSGCGNQFTKKVKTPHGFPLLYLIHSGVMFSGVLFGLLEVYGSGRSWL